MCMESSVKNHIPNQLFITCVCVRSVKYIRMKLGM
jgi:hypothetical protein